MTGKQKCRILKQIRKQIADANDIQYIIEECSHRGSCRGTCPKCEWEVRMLEKALEKRRLAGKKVALAGISAGFFLTACSPIDMVKDLIHSVSPIEGDVMAETTSGAIAETETENIVEGKLIAEPTAGEPVIEDIPGETLPPECETELGEVVPEETDAVLPDEEIEVTAGVPVWEPEETEEEYPEVAGGIGPNGFIGIDPEEELRLEGDVAYTEPEDGEEP